MTKKRNWSSGKTRFSDLVYQVVRRIPSGRVATYGQIAILLGNPRAARAVGNALHRNPDPETIPCHRVVSREGKLAKNFGNGGWREQKRKLLAEGVGFKDEKNGWFRKILVAVWLFLVVNPILVRESKRNFKRTSYFFPFLFFLGSSFSL